MLSAEQGKRRASTPGKADKPLETAVGQMANRCGQRVARVHGPIGLHAEHPPDHETDLLLVGPADAHQRFFDHRGFVVPHRQIIGRTGRNGRTASLTELERGRRVLGGKNLLRPVSDGRATDAFP